MSVVETLKEFKNILFGHKIIVFTDHVNIVHETVLRASDRVMRWRLLLEEYGPEFRYIPGVKNILSDALSRLPTETDCPVELTTGAHVCAIEELPKIEFPVILES